MANVNRWIVLIPLIFSITSAVLATLALLAGHRQGFMEDYAVVRLNTSMVGHDIFSSDNNNNKDDDDDEKSLFDKAKDKAKDKVKDKLGDVTADIADGVADKIGIADWYSLHILDACWGQFRPNATAPSPGLNITNCTQSSVSSRLNLTALVDKQLKVGPLELDLAKIDWPEKIQDTIDVLNSALYALVVIYAIGAALCVFAALLSIISFVKPDKPSLIKTNLIFSCSAALVTVIASIVVTVTSSKGVDELNDVGEKVGLVAVKGTKFYIISLISTGMMLVVATFWIGRHLAVKKRNAGSMTEKTQGP